MSYFDRLSLRYLEISVATFDPPVTASDPPSQKSFCTSTIINAVFKVTSRSCIVGVVVLLL